MPEPTDAASLFEVKRGGVRLDKFVAESSDCGRRSARTLIRLGLVLVEGYRSSAATKLVAGQRVEIIEGSQADRPPEKVPDCAGLEIIAEEAGWMAIAKPAGIHSVAGGSGRSVADLLCEACPGAAEVSPCRRDGGLVNRLDHDTSGVLLAARDRDNWLHLREAFAQHQVAKHYIALVAGVVARPITVDQRLSRRRSRVRPPHRGEKAYPASTSFHPLETAENWSLVLATMRTGVTHQIRAHAALAGFPILGDLKYGQIPGPPNVRTGQLLHALRLVVPGTLDVTAPIAGDFRSALIALRAK